MAEPDKSKISKIRSRLVGLEAEKNRLLQELESETSPVVKKEKYGTPAAPAPLASSKERIALFTKLFRCRGIVFPKYFEWVKTITRNYRSSYSSEFSAG